MKRHLFSLIFIYLITLNSNVSQAATEFDKGRAKVTLGVAQWALFDEGDITALHLTYELPENPDLFSLRPAFSVIKAEEGHSYFAMGFTKRFTIDDNWTLGAGSSMGFLDESNELGHKLEFYTRGFVEYQLTNSSAIALEIGHISNAGFGDINPGSESLVFSYVLNM